MKISELFRRLTFGQLKNLALSDRAAGTIVADAHPEIIFHINEALLRIYSRFVLKTNDLIIEQVEHITEYRLDPRFAESSGSAEPYHYIKDGAPGEEPFRNDVIKILGVFDEFGGPVPLNDSARVDSLFTPYPNVLQVPSPQQGRPLGVEYQARHPVLLDQGAGYLDQDIEVPFFLEGPLQNYVGYLVYSHMNGQENTLKGQEYLGLYDAVCGELTLNDLTNQSSSTSHQKLEQRGFV